MQTLPIVDFNDVIKTIYTTARLADLKDTVKRYPGIKEVREAYENADAALFDPLFCDTGLTVTIKTSIVAEKRDPNC